MVPHADGFVNLGRLLYTFFRCRMGNLTPTRLQSVYLIADERGGSVGLQVSM